MTIPSSRVQPGVPAGGQFAKSPHAEADGVELAAHVPSQESLDRLAGAHAQVNALIEHPVMRMGLVSKEYKAVSDQLDDAVDDCAVAYEEVCGPTLQDDWDQATASAMDTQLAEIDREMENLAATLVVARGQKKDEAIKTVERAGYRTGWQATSKADALRGLEVRLDQQAVTRAHLERTGPDLPSIMEKMPEGLRKVTWPLASQVFAPYRRQAADNWRAQHADQQMAGVR